jgi:TolB-like protein/Tfp pilus assembly protein PilF
MFQRNFFAELKRRNVYKVAVAYAVVGWLVMQIAATIVPALHLPDAITSAVVVLVLLGFPIALILAWAFELTPEGIKRAADVAPNDLITHRTGRKLTVLIVFVAVIALGLLLLQLARRKPAVAPGNPAASSTVSEITPRGIPEKSIAVLPFQNLSKDEENAFFADGVQDEILTDLAKIADLKVISRTSVMQYKNTAARNLSEIAQALKVAHVLEGSVQRSANRVRVSAQLIDARNDTHVWAEKYDRDLADVFAIQSEIAQAIADQLQARLSPTEKSAISERPTSDLAAYDLYLQAKELLFDVNLSRQKENALKAVQLLDQAVARDPNFLLAYCQLAYSHDRIYFNGFDPTETRLGLAETSVKAAVHLQPDSGETHLAQAIHFYWGYLNYDRAREELAKAQAALPNNARIFAFLGRIDRRQGRWDEAVRNLERAVDLDPRNAETLDDLGQTYFLLRRYGEAIAIFNRELVLQPRNAFLRAWVVGVGQDADANMAPERAMVNKIEAEDPASAAEITPISFELARRERDPAAAARALANIPQDSYASGSTQFPHAFYEGLVAQMRQDARGAQAAFMEARAEVEKIVRAQPNNANPVSILALIDAQLGEKEKAIREARTACDMIPISKDAFNGVELITNLATVYAVTGEKDLALEQLEIVTKLPAGPNYGQLRLGPEWDSLRTDPRFEKIVASLAPKGSQ